ncbi:MAG: hypothetical protein KA758_11810 [Acidimicrobiales bacterium]|nr:hypothetical protein [Acidimicrobiales bacterium]
MTIDPTDPGDTSDTTDVSRREALRKAAGIGAVAGVAWAAPAINGVSVVPGFAEAANSIVMAHRISARKFNDDDFLHVVYTFGEHADHLDTMLARQFGGRRFGQDSREVIVS